MNRCDPICNDGPVGRWALAGLLLATVFCAGAEQAERPRTEVVQLSLIGTKPWQRTVVDDLDVLKVEGQRWLPLQRLAKLLAAKVEEKTEQTMYQFDGGPGATLDKRNGLLESPGLEQPIRVIFARSEITGGNEVYVPEGAMSHLLDLPLQWDEAGYAYRVETTRALGLWKTPERASMFRIGANLIPTNLPSVLPTAHPRSFSLDYVDVRMQLGADVARPGNAPEHVALSSLQQTFWGQLLGGGYKVQLSQPGVSWDRIQGLRVDEQITDPVRVEYFDWIYQWDRGEIGLGDANTGLNDLVFPFVQYTGLRVSGVAGEGWNEETLPDSFNRLEGAIIRPVPFAGVAPVGSTVDLFINGQRVNSTEVLTIDPTAPPGFGTWKFEDIRLPPGALNEVRVRVTEPSGVVTQIDRQVLGTNALLPRGGIVYLGSIGTARDVQRMRTGGFIGGGRVMYGLTDRLTIGTVLAYQDRLHWFADHATELPLRSAHAGFEAYWMPLDPLLIVAELATSSGDLPDGRSQDDLAAVIRTSWYPSRALSMATGLFYYGPHYFNGQTLSPTDRMGFWISGRWNAADWMSTEAAVGWAQDNLAGEQAQTLGVGFQSLTVRMYPLPQCRWSYELDRLEADNGEGTPLLHTFEFQSEPLPRWSITGLWAIGSDVVLQQSSDFFAGLNLPGIGLGQTEQQWFRARYLLGPGHSVAAGYFRSQQYERVSMLHDFRTFDKPWLLFHTEIGRNLMTDSIYFENRSDWLFDRQGDWRCGVRAKYEEHEWAVGVYLAITDQLVLHEGGVLRTADIPSEYGVYRGLINPDNSGAIAGRVFIDINADGKPDADEPGLAGVRVMVENLDTAVTNKAGYYVVPRLSHRGELHVWVDLSSVPAIYTPTHAMQSAELRSRAVTTVNLGVTPSHAILGKIVMVHAEDQQAGVGGVRVILRRNTDGSIVTQSITAADGSYYLGDLRPGVYHIELDPETLPAGHDMPRLPAAVSIHPSAEPAEVEMPACLLQAPDAPEQLTPLPRRTPNAPPAQPEILLPKIPTAPSSP
ncbi:MAG: hypothetical protein WC058_04575 [Phycisphaeraceae bacterium]